MHFVWITSRTWLQGRVVQGAANMTALCPFRAKIDQLKLEAEASATNADVKPSGPSGKKVCSAAEKHFQSLEGDLSLMKETVQTTCCNVCGWYIMVYIYTIVDLYHMCISTCLDLFVMYSEFSDLAKRIPCHPTTRIPISSSRLQDRDV